MKKVSVIIPFYNNEKYVETAINNVVSQTYDNIELICINDGSSDNTGNLLKNLQIDSKKIEYKFFTQENQGASAARNTGLNHATGDYIFFLDSDDEIEPTLLEENIQLLEQEESDLILFGHQTYDDKNTVPNRYSNVSKLLTIPVSQFSSHYDSFFEEEVISFFIWNKIYNRKIIEDNNIRFVENQVFGEDALFNFEYYKCMKNITFNPYIYYSYIRRNDSISGSSTMNSSRFQDELNVLHGLNKILLKDYTLSVRRIVRLVMRLKRNESIKLIPYYSEILNLMGYPAPNLSFKDRIKRLYILLRIKLSNL